MPKGVIMNNQNNIKLDTYSKQKLGRAYMALYDALVAEGQAQNMSLGTSWYNELFKISDILKSNQSNVALDYLKLFFMSHRKSEIKKMMTAKERFNTIESNPTIVTAALEKVKQEIPFTKLETTMSEALAYFRQIINLWRDRHLSKSYNIQHVLILAKRPF